MVLSSWVAAAAAASSPFTLSLFWRLLKFDWMYSKIGTQYTNSGCAYVACTSCTARTGIPQCSMYIHHTSNQIKINSFSYWVYAPVSAAVYFIQSKIELRLLCSTAQRFGSVLCVMWIQIYKIFKKIKISFPQCCSRLRLVSNATCSAYARITHQRYMFRCVSIIRETSLINKW